jgi:hypothetical protein
VSGVLYDDLEILLFSSLLERDMCRWVAHTVGWFGDEQLCDGVRRRRK